MFLYEFYNNCNLWIWAAITLWVNTHTFDKLSFYVIIPEKNQFCYSKMHWIYTKFISSLPGLGVALSIHFICKYLQIYCFCYDKQHNKWFWKSFSNMRSRGLLLWRNIYSLDKGETEHCFYLKTMFPLSESLIVPVWVCELDHRKLKRRGYLSIL